jgi:hypothetical protein
LWAAGPAAARAEDVPLASSLQLESVMLVGGWASAGPFIPVIGDGTAHLAYEYYLTNYGKKAARIVSLRVRGIGGAAFATTIEGDAMRSSFTPAAPQSRLAAYDPVLAPGASGVLFVFLNFSGRETPRRLENWIVVEADGDPKNAQRIPLGEVAIGKPGAALSTNRSRAIDGSPQMGRPTSQSIGARLSCSTASRECRNATRSIG